MVDGQVATSSVTDRRLLSVMKRVPREMFLPPERQALAYSDSHHPLGNGRFLPAPAIFVQVLHVAPTDRVLDCWPSTGYSLAVLAGVADHVTGLEPDAHFAETARANLSELGIDNVDLRNGPVVPPAGQSFDAILVEGAVPRVPDELLAALAPGGRLVCLIRNGPVGAATLHTRTAKGSRSTPRSTPHCPRLTLVRRRKPLCSKVMWPSGHADPSA